MPPFTKATAKQAAETRHVVSFALRNISDKGLVDLMWSSVKSGIERRTRSIVGLIWTAGPREFNWLLNEKRIEEWFGNSWPDYMQEANRRGLWPALFLGIDLTELANYIALTTLCSASTKKETKRLVNIGTAAGNTATAPGKLQYAPKGARTRGAKSNGSFRAVPTRR